MVTTHGKGTHKANSGPEDCGSKTTGDAEKSTIAKKDKTHLSNTNLHLPKPAWSNHGKAVAAIERSQPLMGLPSMRSKLLPLSMTCQMTQMYLRCHINNARQVIPGKGLLFPSRPTSRPCRA